MWFDEPHIEFEALETISAPTLVLASGHHVQLERPEIVVAAVQQVKEHRSTH